MEATQLLKDGHDAVRRLFRAFDNAEGDPDAQEELFAQIREELEVHTKIEEELFYPAVREAARSVDDEDGLSLVDEAREEHEEVDELLAKIAATSPTDKTFAKQVKKLRKSVEHHADEEEREMFDFARRHVGSERLFDLGRRMQERKRQLSARDPHAEVDVRPDDLHPPL